MRWSAEDKEHVLFLSNEGWTAREISAHTEIPLGTVAGWRKKVGVSTKSCYKDLYIGTIEEIQSKLISIMLEAPEISYNYFNSADSGTPSATTYRKYFGSWNNALRAANIQPAKKDYTRSKCINDNKEDNKEDNKDYEASYKYSQKPDKLTKVYLIEFEGFYKVGTTQQSITQRFGNRYPKYEVIFYIEVSLTEALKIEKEWLNNVKHLKFVPTTFPEEGRGFTECFKFEA